MKLRCFYILFVGLFCFTPRFFAQPYTVADLGWNGQGPGGGAYLAYINNPIPGRSSAQVAGSGIYFVYGVVHGYFYNGALPAIDIGSLGAYPTYPTAIN